MNKKKAREIIEENKKTYNLIASDFSDTRSRIWPEMTLLVKKYVKAGDKVLDLGCGNGRLTDILPEGVDYLGVDVSGKLIEEAKKNFQFPISNFQLRKINFKIHNILDLEQLSEKKFDVVFMFAVLNHIPSEELLLKILRDINKLLKPGGYLIMTNWNLWQLGQKKSVWNRKIQREGFRDLITVWQSGDKKRQGELYYRAFTKSELPELLEKAGFKILENYYSCGDKKCHWWNGRNLVTVVKKY